jgi:hypothetical protein
VDATGKARPMSDVLLDVADRFKAMPNGAEKSRAAVELFGKAGVSLIPMLNNGKQGLADLTAEAEKLGLVLSGETAASAELINDNITRLKKTADGLGRQLLTALAPALSILTTEMAQNAIKTQDMKEKQEAAIVIMKTMMIAARSVGFAFQYAGSLIARFFAGFINEAKTALVILQNMPAAVKEIATGTPGNASRRIAEAMTIANEAQAVMDRDREKMIAEFEADVERMQNAKADASVAGLARMEQLKAEANGIIEATKSNQARLAEEMAKLNEIFGAGLIDRETFNKRKKQLEEQFRDAGKGFGKALKDGAQGASAKALGDAAAKIMQDMRAAAERIFDETRTVAEKAADKIIEVQSLWRAGLIDEETATRATRAAEGERDRERLEAMAKIKEQADEVRESLLTDVQRLERSGAELERLFLGGDIDRVTYIAAIRKLNEELDPATRKMRELGQAGVEMELAFRTPAEQIQAELERMNELLAAGVISAETYQRALAKLFPTAEKTLTQMDKLGASAASALASSFQQFLFDPFNVGLDGMVKGFASAMAKIVAEIIAKQAVLALFGGAGASPAVKASLGFADGGYVAGPGTATSDSIPARLSNGEYVMPANTVRHFGVDFMDAIRAMRPARQAPVARFAEGGYVDGQGGGGGGGVRVVNVVDSSMMQDYLTSSAGEQVVMNVIRRNRRQVSQVIA